MWNLQDHLESRDDGSFEEAGIPYPPELSSILNLERERLSDYSVTGSHKDGTFVSGKSDAIQDLLMKKAEGAPKAQGADRQKIEAVIASALVEDWVLLRENMHDFRLILCTLQQLLHNLERCDAQLADRAPPYARRLSEALIKLRTVAVNRLKACATRYSVTSVFAMDGAEKANEVQSAVRAKQTLALSSDVMNYLASSSQKKEKTTSEAKPPPTQQSAPPRALSIESRLGRTSQNKPKRLRTNSFFRQKSGKPSSSAGSTAPSRSQPQPPKSTYASAKSSGNTLPKGSGQGK
jgi:hypothetical protein